MSRKNVLLALSTTVAIAALLLLLLRGPEAAPPGLGAQELAPRQPPAVAIAPPPVGRELVPATSPPAGEAAGTSTGAYAEFVDREWQDLRHTGGKGELEVLLLRGKQPVCDARVRLWMPASKPEHPVLDGTAKALREAHTDAAGRAVFQELSTGEYDLRADDAGDSVFRTDLHVDSTLTSMTMVLLLGRSAIEGQVCDEQGAPMPGARVMVRGIGPQPTRETGVYVQREGRFRVGGLSAGHYYVGVQMQRNGAWYGEEPRMVSLGIDDTATMLFGRPFPFLRWSGRLLDGEAGVIPGVRRLWLRHRQRNDQRALLTDAQGAFAVELPDGAWQVYLGDGLLPGVSFATVDVAGSNVQQDLTLPGIRIVGELQPEEATAFDVRLATYGLRLGRVGAPEQEVTPDGPFATPEGSIVQWLGVEPGDYGIHGDQLTRVLSNSAGVQALSVLSGVRTVRVPIYLRQLRR